MPGETNSSEELALGSALIYISSVQTGKPRQGWRSEGLREPAACRAPGPRPLTGGPRVALQRRSPGAGVSVPALVSRARADARAAKRPAAGGSCDVGLLVRCARTDICMKTGTPFAGRTRSGVHRALQRPTAVRPSRDQEGRGRAGRNRRLGARFCRLITLFPEAWERGLGTTPLPRHGGSGRSGAVVAPGLRSQPSPPRPRTSISADGVGGHGCRQAYLAGKHFP